MTSVLVLRREWELDPRRRVWGTGGWVSPEEREALDWLTLVRLLGWQARTATAVGGDRPDVCVVASDLEERPEEGAALLEWVREGTTAVVPHASAPAAVATGVERLPASSGRAVLWTGGGGAASWTARADVPYTPLAAATGWDALAEVDGNAAVVGRRHGNGTVVVAGFHPSTARDSAGSATALLVHLLTRTAPPPVVWLDLSHTVVLRMDDPGGAQNVYSRDWCYPKLTSAQWREIAGALERRRGRMSVAYSAGFVDDGNGERGRLLVGGARVARVPGRVHPSPLVRYEDVAGHAPSTVYDYRDEYAGLRALVREGAAGVELHGYTHVHPDYETWAAAPDRYDRAAWYRELGPRASAALARLPAGDHPLARGSAGIERWFGRRPTTLVCPGEEWTDDALEAALGAGLSLVGSYYLALRHEDRLCWSTHVCSPYLDEPEARWFDSGLPVVGYMHDRDLVVNGVGWLDEWMSAWEARGARRFVDYASLAALLATPLSVTGGDGRWVVAGVAGGLPDRCAVRAFARTGSPGRVSFTAGGRSGAEVETTGDAVALEIGAGQAPGPRS